MLRDSGGRRIIGSLAVYELGLEGRRWDFLGGGWGRYVLGRGSLGVGLGGRPFWTAWGVGGAGCCDGVFWLDWESVVVWVINVELSSKRYP